MKHSACPSDDLSAGPPCEAGRTAQRAAMLAQNERRRQQVIELLANGMPIQEVEAATGYRPRTIRRIAQRYREAGVAGLVDRRQHSVGATPLLSAEQQEELRQALRHPPPDGGEWTGAKVARWMVERLGRPVRRQRGWDYLRRLQTASAETSS
ncbi:MAG TPA: helix-turn-helix domain-containing protein [Roseiflexaceae bacterium]|nr:helix-turn-helix domain-containing protein [Roseiflexaceae bacterium]